MLKSVYNLLASLLFAAIFISIPWEDLRGYPFVDLLNYLKTINEVRQYGFEYYDLGETWIDYLKNEYLWYLLTWIIATSSLEPLVALKMISAFCAFIYHRYLAVSIGNALAFLFLMNPISITLLGEQLRSAFAFSLLLLALMLFKRPQPIFITIPFLLFIHSAMIPLSMLFAATRWLADHRDLRPAFKALLVVFAAIAVALFVTKIVPALLVSIGDRRDVTTFEVQSLAYVAFWIVWGAMLVDAAGASLTDDWRYLFAVFITVSIPAMAILGFPGFRLLALAVPIILSTLPKLGQQRRFIAGLSFVLYQIILFDYWIRT